MCDQPRGGGGGVIPISANIAMKSFDHFVCHYCPGLARESMTKLVCNQFERAVCAGITSLNECSHSHIIYYLRRIVVKYTNWC